jgi:hypothetical protein
MCVLFPGKGETRQNFSTSCRFSSSLESIQLIADPWSGTCIALPFQDFFPFFRKHFVLFSAAQLFVCARTEVIQYPDH